MRRPFGGFAIGILVLFIGHAVGQAVLTNHVESEGGGSVQLSTSRVTFTIIPSDLPRAGTVSYVVPSHESPFDLVTLAPLEGPWLLTVRFSQPLGLPDSLAEIPPANLEVSAEVADGSTAATCPIVPWTRVGAGARLAFVEGPGVCRYRVRLRLRFAGRYPPGEFQGVLLWTFKRPAI